MSVGSDEVAVLARMCMHVFISSLLVVFFRYVCVLLLSFCWRLGDGVEPHNELMETDVIASIPKYQLGRSHMGRVSLRQNMLMKSQR